jgi:hypothetical protein
MERIKKYNYRVEITGYAHHIGKERIDAVIWQGDELTLYKNLDSQNHIFTDDDFSDRETWEPLVEDMIHMLGNRKIEVYPAPKE